MSDIQIRNAISDDREALSRFYHEHFEYNERLADGEAWDWMFVDQPSNSTDIPFLVLESANQIVGSIGWMETILMVDSRAICCALPMYFFVALAHRGLPALRLFRKLFEKHPVVIGSNMTPEAERFISKAGFIDFSDSVRTYFYTLIPAGNIHAHLIHVARRTHEYLLRWVGKLIPHRITHRVSKTLDAEFVTNCQPDHDLNHLQKSLEWLNWRYCQSPLMKSSTGDVNFIYQFRSGKPAAFSVIHINNATRQLTIQDVIWKNDADMGLLIDQMIQIGRHSGCASIFTEALSKKVHQAARLRLFSTHVSEVKLMVSVKESTHGKQASDPERWHFMLGDLRR